MFAAAGAAVKLALRDLSPVQLVFWRNLASMLIFGSYLYFARPQAFGDLRSGRVDLHVCRSILSLAVLYAYFFAVSRIPLPTAVLLLSTSPVFVPVLAFLVLGHRSGIAIWIGVLIAFFGVALIIDPTLTFGDESTSVLGMVGGLIAGILGGAATVVIWKMSNSEGPDRQMIYFTVISFVLSVPMSVYTWQFPQWETFIPIIFLGIATTLAQYYLSKGCQVAPADKINTWNYLSTVVAALAGYIGWDEKLSTPTVIGMCLVVVGAQITSKRFKR
jgi:drug/metabolite transporter (DMT)-like permease